MSKRQNPYIRALTADELNAAKHIEFCCIIGPGHIVYGDGDAIDYAFRMDEREQQEKKREEPDGS